MSLKIALNFETDTRQGLRCCCSCFDFQSKVSELILCCPREWLIQRLLLQMMFWLFLGQLFTGWCLGSPWFVQEFSMKRFSGNHFTKSTGQHASRSRPENCGIFRKERKLEVEEHSKAHSSQWHLLWCQMLWKFPVWGVLMFSSWNMVSSFF